MIDVTKIVTTIILFVILIPYVSMAKDTDLDVSSIKWYGYFEGAKSVTYYIDDKPVKVEEGKTLRHEFNSFDNVEGVITHIIDIEATVSNRSEKPVMSIEVTLSISPKIAYFVYDQDVSNEKIWGIEATEHTAEWFAPIILTQKKIDKLDANSLAKVVFGKIELKKIINDYWKKDLWPTEFKFEVSIEPQEPEKTFSNNTTFRLLKIPVPVY